MKNILFVSIMLLTALPAHALVGGAVDSNNASSPWAGVGAVTVNGSTFSGALIDSQYVLTAAHVVNGAAPGSVSFILNAGSTSSHVVAAQSITVFPGYTGTTPGPDGVWHDDLSLIKLATPINDVSSYGFYSGPLSGQTLTLAGYGAGGNGTHGVNIPANSNVKRVGQNRVDVILKDNNGGPQAEIYVFDFDGPDASTNVYGNPAPPNLTLGANVEAQFAGGDSGSPAFVYDNGVWKIAGIGTFNGSTTGLPGSNVKFGSVGGGTIIAPYLGFINATIAASVPEADTYVMLLVGLGLIGLLTYRRKVKPDLAT